MKISDKCRYLLLIFSFKEIRISVIAIVAQIYLYIMLVLFILSKVAPPETIAMISNDPNQSVIEASIDSYCCDTACWYA